LRDAGKKGSAITNSNFTIDRKVAAQKGYNTRVRKGTNKLHPFSSGQQKINTKKAAVINQGTVFMYCIGIGIRRIRKDLVPQYIEQGWYYGSPNAKIFRELRNLE